MTMASLLYGWVCAVLVWRSTAGVSDETLTNCSSIVVSGASLIQKTRGVQDLRSSASLPAESPTEASVLSGTAASAYAQLLRNSVLDEDEDEDESAVRQPAWKRDALSHLSGSPLASSPTITRLKITYEPYKKSKTIPVLHVKYHLLHARAKRKITKAPAKIMMSTVRSSNAPGNSTFSPLAS
mmetsp:Transcript_78128/g.135499  ORF Transcript_78128/g.135499 Transcript_78128/m.135499 type:complete len:183 (-) Transcript_78128:1612-2160(-)